MVKAPICRLAITAILGAKTQTAKPSASTPVPIGPCNRSPPLTGRPLGVPACQLRRNLWAERGMSWSFSTDVGQVAAGCSSNLRRATFSTLACQKPLSNYRGCMGRWSMATWRNGSAFGFDCPTVPKGCRFESCGGHFCHFLPGLIASWKDATVI